MEKPLIIEKEEIPRYNFVKHEVLEDVHARLQRTKDLEKAMIFGNNDKGKIGIIFETEEGTREVSTTVWMAADDNVVLKAGINIPIHCIHEIRLYRTH
jgi:uncharacterized protein (UPF0248 family)